MDISLVAVIISLIILMADPIVARWNKSIYSRNKDQSGARERFKKAMKRRGYYKTGALLFLIIASIMTIYSNKEEIKMADQKFDKLESSLRHIDCSVKEIGGRITKIEKFLWGGGGPGESKPVDPKNPDSGPISSSSYLTIDERFSGIENTLSDLGQRALTQEDLEEIHEEIIELRAAIREYEKLMHQIGAMPAG